MLKSSPHLYKIFNIHNKEIYKITKIIVLCILIVIISLISSINAYADSVNTDEYSRMCFDYDLIRKLQPTGGYETAPEWYDTYIHTPITTDEAKAMLLSELTKKAKTAYDILPVKSPISCTIDNTLDTMNEFSTSYYKASKLTRSELASIYDYAGECYAEDQRVVTLDDLHMSIRSGTTINYDSLLWVSDGKSPFLNNTGTVARDTNITSFMNVVEARLRTDDSNSSYDNEVYCYFNRYIPIVFYTGQQSTFLVYGNELPHYYLFIYIDNDTLLGIDMSYYSCVGLNYYFANNGQTLNDLYLYTCQAGGSSYRKTAPQDLTAMNTSRIFVYYRGQNIGDLTYDDFSHWELIDKMQKNAGLLFDPTGTIEPEPIELPDDLPFNDDSDSDSDNDTINVLIPYVDGSLNFGDLKFYDDDTYNEYVNNGLIVEGDYINDYSTTQNNEIINNYNNTIINNYYSGNGEYDDTNLLGKLDIIISKLTEISNKIGNTTQTIIDDTGEIFSGEPVYVDFGDCITQNLPIVSDVQNMLEDLQPTSGVSIESELLTSQTDHNNVDNSVFGQAFQNPITIDLSWYEPYRTNMRNFLKIPCWIMGIAAMFSIIKSVFGVKTGGGG